METEEGKIPDKKKGVLKMERGRILVIDDEEIALVAFERELESAGYEVKTALSGKDALEIAKDGNFDIVYTDLVMPGMDGIEVCRKIKKISPATEIVLVSGYPVEVEKYSRAFIDAGGRYEIIKKPLSEDELIRTTEKVLREIREKKGG